MAYEILTSGVPQYAAAYAIGHVIGAYIDKRAIQNSESNQQQIQEDNRVDPSVLRAPETLRAAVERATAEDPDQYKSTNVESAVRVLISPVAGFAGASAVLLAYGLLPGAAIETAPPKVGLVIDHSFDTSTGDQPAVDRINKLVDQFDTERVNASAIVASNGVHLPVALNKVAEDEPFGSAPLGAATSFALNNKNSAVLIATNGNRIGDPKSVIAEAQKNKTPVYIVNVESETEVEPAAINQLKEIAKATKGKYWDSKISNASDVSKNVNDTLIPNEIDRVQKTGKEGALGLAALLTFFGAVTYRKRADLTYRTKKLRG